MSAFFDPGDVCVVPIARPSVVALTGAVGALTFGGAGFLLGRLAGHSVIGALAGSTIGSAFTSTFFAYPPFGGRSADAAQRQEPLSARFP